MGIVDDTPMNGPDRPDQVPAGKPAAVPQRDILSDVEIRILAVLIEKSLTQPAAYPLTLNAILLGCNQKQNRDPVVDYSETTVAQAIYGLQEKGLVSIATAAPGARANRFGHHAAERYRWDRPSQAIVAELLLRGKQTAGEIRARASRMVPFESADAVAATLADLCNCQPPWVQELPREPGRAAARYRHLLASSPHKDVGASPGTSAATHSGATESGQADLESRVAHLEADVKALFRLFDELRGRGGKPVDSGEPSAI